MGLAERERGGERDEEESVGTMAERERKRGMDGQHRQNRCPALLPFSSQLVVASLYRQINIRLMWPAAAVTTDSCLQVNRMSPGWMRTCVQRLVQMAPASQDGLQVQEQR